MTASSREILYRTQLEAVASGSKEGMRALYEEFAPGLIQFIESRVSDRIDAADVAHETFMAVWSQAGLFEGRSSVKTWIYSIARFKALDRLRRMGREMPLNEDYDAPDPSVDLVAAAENASDADRVRACIAKLSDTHRRVVQLAFYEELDYAEISEIEDVPVGTIKTRVFHAKRLLMHCLVRQLVLP